MNLHCYLLVRENHGCINFCPLLSIWILNQEFYSADQIFFPDWKPEFLKQLGPHRHLSENWWNWCKNERASGVKYHAEGIFH